MGTDHERRMAAHRAYDLARKMEEAREVFAKFDDVKRQVAAESQAEEDDRKRAVRRRWWRGPWLTWLLYGAPWAKLRD
jgi:hypothetical protein